ncbi:major allergen Pru ar 1-like [Tripterygium wilfordii]|uniref:major allergen Pru ar 1-like n=1 Tax=Tripterygium wilfordii TaxID=458696 RepID=UPI0018F7F774|nr:major allergen Pru ar 1-like [Tripterygium wilfordii]
MGVVSYQTENFLAIAPNRLFKAYADGANFFPKVIPIIKSIEIIEGNGGAGTIQKFTFVGDGGVTYVKHKIEALDQDTLTYNFSIIEGDLIKGALEKISSENKIVASPDGGSIWKTTATYHFNSDVVIPEDKLNEAKEKSTAMFKAVEAYLLANPDAY